MSNAVKEKVGQESGMGSGTSVEFRSYLFDEEISRTHRHAGNTLLRIGAFLCAAVCSLAVARAVAHPEAKDFGEATEPVSEMITSISTLATTTHLQASLPTGTSLATTSRRATTAQTTMVTTMATTTTPVVTTKAILSKTRTEAELAKYFAEIPLSNEAQLTYDPEQIAGLVPKFTVTDEPLVLIMHTHGSEGYTDTDGRSEDIDQNVVAVGRTLQETLEEYGIPTLHDERMYDVPSYTRSYNEAYTGIKAALEKNPSIQIVLDVHRDAYSYSDGTLLKTSQTFSGTDGEFRSARVMFLVGTNAGTLEHPTWRSHLAFAMALQTRMEDIVPGITRAVFLRKQRFNEHLTPGSLLVEVGSSGDSLAEAKNAVRIFGQALAEELLSPKN